MARPGNKNARKHVDWNRYALKTREDLDRFIQIEIRAISNGEIGTRQASAINGSIRLLLEVRGWIKKTPLQITQPRMIPSSQNYTLDEITRALEALPVEAQDIFLRKLPERGSAQSQTGS